MDERLAFIAEYRQRQTTMSALCRGYGISRKTGYQLVARYTAEGPVGLRARSRAPQHHPQAITPVVRAVLLALRSAHPYWGPRKLRARLQAQHPTQAWPAASSVGALLRHAGLTRPAGRRRAAPAARPPLTASREPNDVWTIDFKGLVPDRRRPPL